MGLRFKTSQNIYHEKYFNMTFKIEISLHKTSFVLFIHNLASSLKISKNVDTIHFGHGYHMGYLGHSESIGSLSLLLNMFSDVHVHLQKPLFSQTTPTFNLTLKIPPHRIEWQVEAEDGTKSLEIRKKKTPQDRGTGLFSRPLFLDRKNRPSKNKNGGETEKKMKVV